MSRDVARVVCDVSVLCRLLMPDLTTLRSQDSPSWLLLAIVGTTQHQTLSLSVIADLEWQTVQEENEQNRQLLPLEPDP